jgi:two-component system sensor histidine kinase KdpD
MRVSELLRPSPERLLLQAQAEETKQWGARLKIFLGYAPGVGKSYRMLDEARRRHDRGFRGAGPKKSKRSSAS